MSTDEFVFEFNPFLRLLEDREEAGIAHVLP